MTVKTMEKQSCHSSSSSSRSKTNSSHSRRIILMTSQICILTCVTLIVLTDMYKYLIAKGDLFSPPPPPTNLRNIGSDIEDLRCEFDRSIRYLNETITYGKKHGDDCRLTYKQKTAVSDCSSCLEQTMELLVSAELNLQKAINSSANSQVEAACAEFKQVDYLLLLASLETNRCLESFDLFDRVAGGVIHGIHQSYGGIQGSMLKVAVSNIKNTRNKFIKEFLSRVYITLISESSYHSTAINILQKKC